MQRSNGGPSAAAADSTPAQRVPAWRQIAAGLFSRMCYGAFTPRVANGFNVQVGRTHGLQTLRTQFLETGVKRFGNAAEFGVAGITQPQYGIVQFGQLRCTATT